MCVKDLARLYTDISGDIKINWSAIGAVDITTAEKFAKHILKLVDRARKIRSKS